MAFRSILGWYSLLIVVSGGRSDTGCADQGGHLTAQAIYEEGDQRSPNFGGGQEDDEAHTVGDRQRGQGNQQRRLRKYGIPQLSPAYAAGCR